MAMNPVMKTIFTHLVAIFATAVATTGWATSHGVDLYAIWNQLNVVIAEITKLLATVTPVATMIYGIYRSQVKNRVQEIGADPSAIEKVKQMPVTAETAALADALTK